MEQEKCPICKRPRSLCQDAEREWFPQRYVCYADMAQAAASAMWIDAHEDEPYHDGTFADWAKDRSAEHPFHRDDGVRIWVSEFDLSPEDDFI